MNTSALRDDGIGGKGVSARAFAERVGLSEHLVVRYCRDGKIFGARRHSLTKKWWIYPPAKLLCEPRKKQGNTSTLMTSTLLDAKQV